MRGTLLTEAEIWLDDRENNLGQTERDFIRASVALKERAKMVKNIVNEGAEGRNLSGTDLSEVYLGRVNLHRADLRRANLSQANLIGTKLDDTTYIDDKWRLVWEIVNEGAEGRNLSGTDLSEVYLGGAILSRADLSQADLRGANLGGAKLGQGNRRWTVLIWTQPDKAKLNKARYNTDTIWPDGFDPQEAGAELSK